MSISGRKEIHCVELTNEQKETDNKLKTLLDENNIEDDTEIRLAVYRLQRLGFIGGAGLSLDVIHDKLSVAFDKYIEHGFKLTDKEKSFLTKNKEAIVSLFKPFYWEENNSVVGIKFEMDSSDHIDGFPGIFNLNINDFVYNAVRKVK
jgi:hypothetical protein